MPSKSKSQARFFAAAAHNPEFAKKAGISTDTAKEWNKADEKAGTLKKSSDKPEKVEETMRGWVDVVQDAEIADEIADTDYQTELSLAQHSPDQGLGISEEEEFDLQGKPVKPGQKSAPVHAGTSTERLEEMPQRFDAFANQDRDEFVDKTAKLTGMNNAVPFTQHENFDIMQIKSGDGFIAVDKQGKQIAILSGYISSNAVVGVPKVFVENAVAAKSNVKGVVYQMYMDIIDHGYAILSDGLHSDDAIKFWTRLLTNHSVYIVGDGEVLAKATPEKVHKYWSEDEASPSAELRLLLIK